MIIVSAADEKFAPHFATLLHSAWTMHPDAEFHLIDCGLEELTKAKLLDFAARHTINLLVTDVNMRRLEGLPTTAYLSLAMYARLLIPYAIPHARRAIYLDADTAVVGDLTELWQADMNGHVVAGAYDSNCPRTKCQPDYINSGVLLIDCVAWRQGQIPEWCIAHASQHQSKWPDQDAINTTCRGHIHMLQPKWNFMLHDPSHDRPPEDLRIIHWSGPNKPWFYKDALMSSIYLFHRNLTPFSLETPPRVYRGPLRTLLNLLIGRPKYWRRMLMHVRCRIFVLSYLRSVMT